MPALAGTAVWWPLATVGLAGATRALHRRWRTRRVLARLGEPGDRRTWCRCPPATRLASSITRRVDRMRRRPSLADDVAPTLEAIARAVAAGVGLGAAMRSLLPAEPGRPFVAVLEAASHDHELGADLGAAIANSGGPTERAVPEVALGLTILEVAATHGGSAATTLHRAATTVRERRTVIAERAVHSAQARLSALVLTLVPVAFGSWTAVTDIRVRHFLVGTRGGAVCLVAGLALNLAGWSWMRRAIRGRV